MILPIETINLILPLILLAAFFLIAGQAVAAEIEVDFPEAREENLVQRVDFTDRAMATEYQFILYVPIEKRDRIDAMSVAHEAMATVHDLEARFSRFRPDSQVSRINASASRAPVRVAPDVFRLFDKAGRMHSRTDGAFDITVGPLLKLWGLYYRDGQIPSDDDRKEAMERVGFDRLLLDRSNFTVGFGVRSMHVDFGGIAKGYALDEAAKVFKRFGITSGLLSAGTSSMVILGPPPSQKDWKIRIRNPYNENESYTELSVSEGALSTSGAYERFIEIDGIRYGHIIDPSTGMPVPEGMVSATAIAPTGTESDALSTAFFVLGPEGVEAYCAKYPENQAVLVLTEEDGSRQVRKINMDSDKEQS